MPTLCQRVQHRGRVHVRQPPCPAVDQDESEVGGGAQDSFTWTDYRDLLIAAHRQLGAPIVLVWDNLNVHKDRRLREFIDTHDWITCYFLPAYAPDLNPVEGIWSLLRRSSQVNTAFTDPDDLISTLRHGLRQIQYRSNLIDGCLAETCLTTTTPRRQRQ
ncbi:transposase [Streptomyces fagopyri]|uniref:transposase n=1 Tax=Streptomyces fagopyri TaxID=2662397 RepID=UPI0036A45B4C